MPLYRHKSTCLIISFLILINMALCLPTAEASLFSISTKDEIEMGRNAAKQIEQKYGLVNDPALQERVDRIGKQIVAVCDRKDLPYSFKVLNSKDINAFALPGGFIYIYKGLIDYLSTDEELAGVIGHEVAHVVKRHTVRQIEKSQAYSMGFLLLFGSRGAILQNLAFNAIMAGYSRSDEEEADKLGFIHTMRAGLNPYSMILGLQRLGDLGGSANFDLFADHPQTSIRVDLLKNYMRDAKITPQVAQKSNAAQITAPGLNLPPLYATYRNLKPVYRAELAAGAFYQLLKLPDYSGDRFITNSDGTYITIFYEDREIIVLTPQDASSNQTSLEDLANQYIYSIRTWLDNSKS